MTRVVDFGRACANSVLAMQSFLKLFLIALLFFMFYSPLRTCRRRSGGVSAVSLVKNWTKSSLSLYLALSPLIAIY